MNMLTKVSTLYMLSLLVARGNAQERPVYDTPRWAANVTHRQNFCAQHAAVERGEVELRDALSGLSLHVGFLGFQMNQETGAIDEENPDIAVRFLDELARRAGFDYRNNYGIVDPPGSNDTWTGLLEFITDVYDAAGDFFYETSERLERNIIYPEGWFDANYIMVMKTGVKTEVNLFAFTAPFTPAVWAVIALMTVVSGLVYYMLDYFDSRIKRRPMDVGLESSLFLAAFSFNGHYAYQPKSRSTRILVFSLAFFFVLIVACYTANLASFLVLKNRQVIITDVQDAIKKDLTFCVDEGSPYLDFLKAFRIQPKHLVQLKTPPEDEGESEVFLGLLAGKCDIVFTSKGVFEDFRRSHRHNPDCDLEIVGRIQKFLSGGFALKDSEQYCASLVRDVLHLHMYEMKGTEKFNTIWNDFLNKAATSTCDLDPSNDTEDENYASMGLANLGGMFFLHAVALFVALGVTFFQFCQQPLSRKKAMMTELKEGIFGKTTLNKAVSQRSSGKNNPTSIGGEIEGPPALPAAEEETSASTDLVEKMDYTRAAMEQKEQQRKALIEKLLQQMQTMDERNQRVEERSKKMEKKIEQMEEFLQRN